jgi:hypothetical protein
VSRVFTGKKIGAEIEMSGVRTGAVFLIAAVTAWFGLIQPGRRWYLHWGATQAEVARPMPLAERQHYAGRP